MKRLPAFVLCLLLSIAGARGQGSANKNLSITVAAGGPQWTGILPANRAADWTTAGVEGGIPSAAWTQCGSTIAAGATAATIQAAINACTPGSLPANGKYVLLGAGTFNITGLVINTNGVVLRGAGANQTFLIVSAENSNTSCQISSIAGAIDICTNAFPTMGSANFTAGYALGTTQITLSSIAAVSVGTVMLLTQNDDASDGWPATGDMYVCESPAPDCSRKAGGRDFFVPGNSFGTMEWVRVTAINQAGCGATCVTINPPITLPNFRSGQSPTAQIYPGGSMISYSGVENLSVDSTPVGSSFKFVRCDNCWAKAVRGVNTSTGANDFHVVSMLDVFHLEVRDSYFYGDLCATGCINNYGAIPSWVGSLRWENNIQHGLQADFIPDNGPMTNSVIAYNFFTGNPGVVIDLHATGEMMNLWEGNVWGGLWSDVTHGTHFFQTMFRNAFIGNRYASGTGNINSAVRLETNSRFMNVVGNVMGGVSEYTTYEIVQEAFGICDSTAMFNLGSAGCNGGITPSIITDSNVKRTLLRWANWDSVTNATRFCGNSSDTGWSTTCASTSEVPSAITNFPNPVPTKGDTGIGQAVMPPSFYYASKPSWWPTAKAWPPIGPDVTGGNIPGLGGHAYTNPAADCYLSTMSGPVNGSGGVLSFNAGACYP
jgi:hypothetical protein